MSRRCQEIVNPRGALEIDPNLAEAHAALAYTKIVPVDEVVTLILFYREDEHLKRLMLSEAEAKELDRLWAAVETYASRDRRYGGAIPNQPST